MESTRRVVIIICWCIVALGAGAMISKIFVANSPPKPSDEPTIVAAYLVSSDFEKLPDAVKKTYVLAVRRAHDLPEPESFGQEYPFDPEELSEAQREQMEVNFRTVRQSRFLERIEIYYSLPAGERDAYMDQVIERFDRRYLHAEAEGEGAGYEWQGPDLDYIRSRMGELDAATEERVADFLAAMRARRRVLSRQAEGG